MSGYLPRMATCSSTLSSHVNSSGVKLTICFPSPPLTATESRRSANIYKRNYLKLLHKVAPTAWRYIINSAKQRSQSSTPMSLRFFASLRPKNIVEIGVRIQTVIIALFPSGASMMALKYDRRRKLMLGMGKYEAHVNTQLLSVCCI